MNPEDRKYTQSHEWVQVDGDIATIGLTDYAQEKMGDIVYVELPQVGETLESGARLAVVESVKAASDVFSALGGEVVEANEALESAPEQINQAPWTSWIARIRISDADSSGLMDAQAYDAFVQAEEAKS